MGRRQKIEEMLCDECGKDSNELWKYKPYLNDDKKWYCRLCYDIIYPEVGNEKLQNNKDDGTV